MSLQLFLPHPDLRSCTDIWRQSAEIADAREKFFGQPLQGLHQLKESTHDAR